MLFGWSAVAVAWVYCPCHFALLPCHSRLASSYLHLSLLYLYCLYCPPYCEMVTNPWLSWLQMLGSCLGPPGESGECVPLGSNRHLPESHDKHLRYLGGSDRTGSPWLVAQIWIWFLLWQTSIMQRQIWLFLSLDQCMAQQHSSLTMRCRTGGS